MTRRSNKAVEAIILESHKKDGIELDRKITLATEGFFAMTNSRCETILRDRNRLSKENALTISEYTIAMKREVNPRPSYIKYTVQFLSEFSKSIGMEKRFEDMTRDEMVNGKTGSRHIPLIQSIPYIKEWLSNHPSRNNPKSPLFVGLDSHNMGRRAAYPEWIIPDVPVLQERIIPKACW